MGAGTAKHGLPASLAMICALSLTACDMKAPADGQSAPVVETDQGDNLLTGHWQVTEISGQALTTSPAISVSLTDGTLVANSGCIKWTWDLDLASEPARVGAIRPDPVCERGRTADELRFLEVMQGRPTVSGDANMLTIDGETGSAKGEPPKNRKE